MKQKLEIILNRYVFVPSNSARSWCPDCNNVLRHDSKICTECGSERKSVAIQMHEPITFGGTKKPRKLRRTFYLPILHVALYGLMLCVLLLLKPSLLPRMETLDWFFSTVTQAYIALIALLVAVTTFRLQANNNERYELGARVLEQLKYFIDAEADGLTIEDALSEGKAIRNKQYTHEVRGKRIENLITRVKRIEQSSITSKSRLKTTFIASVFAALSSLVFLLGVDYLYQLHLDILALIIVLEAISISTYYTWLFIKSIR